MVAGVRCGGAAFTLQGFRANRHPKLKSSGKHGGPFLSTKVNDNALTTVHQQHGRMTLPLTHDCHHHALLSSLRPTGLLSEVGWYDMTACGQWRVVSP